VNGNINIIGTLTAGAITTSGTITVPDAGIIGSTLNGFWLGNIAVSQLWIVSGDGTYSHFLAQNNDAIFGTTRATSNTLDSITFRSSCGTPTVVYDWGKCDGPNARWIFNYPISAGTISGGTAGFSAMTVKGPYNSALYSTPGLGGSASAQPTQIINWSNGNVQQIVVTGNTTFTFSNGVPGGRYMLITRQGSGTLQGAITWPTVGTLIWAGGLSSITNTVSAVDIYSFVYDGVKYHGTASNDFK
jgi:hypothetical protein